MSKFTKLFALASKATSKTFNVTRSEAEGSVSLKFDGFPAEFSPQGVEALAAERGARVTVKADVGAAVGKGQGVLGMTAAAEFVREMTTAGDVEEPVRRSRITATPATNGTVSK